MDLAEQAFDDIVSGFYRAASSVMSWRDALLPLQRAMAAWIVQLHGVNTEQGTVAFSYEVGEAAPEAAVDYVRTYHRIDPRAALTLRSAPGEWINCWEHFDDAFVARDPFYQDFLIPYGGRYVSGSKLLQDGPLHVILGVHRGRASNPFSDGELSILHRLARHLAEALRIHRTNLKTRQTGDLGAELLSRLRAPVALVDDQRRLLYCNPSARELLARAHSLVDSDGCLYCRRRKDDIVLLQTLRDLQLSRNSQLHTTTTEKAFFSVRSVDGGASVGLYFYAIRPQATLGAFGSRTVAMLLFHEANARVEIDPFIAAATFDLTPAEARVGIALARGRSPGEIAISNSVSISTVRSQLRALFAKTGTTRQTELVGILASLPVVRPTLGPP